VIPADTKLMPLPALINPDAHTDELCDVAARWGLDVEVVERLVRMSGALEFGVSIISGERSPAEQDALRRSGRPTADNDKSTHLACPATGVDVMPQIAVTTLVKARLGTEGVLAGLRWGGGSPVTRHTDAGGGTAMLPSDWNHFDLGPRTG